MSGNKGKQPAAAAPPPPTTAAEMYGDWERKVTSMNRATNALDWSKVDWSKLNPRDIGVQMGPPMTEEQFREYRERRAAAGGGSVHVVGAAKKP